jgi:hypothetical protein
VFRHKKIISGLFSDYEYLIQMQIKNILTPNQDRRITHLYTCTDLGYRNRRIVLLNYTLEHLVHSNASRLKRFLLYFFFFYYLKQLNACFLAILCMFYNCIIRRCQKAIDIERITCLEKIDIKSTS